MPTTEQLNDPRWWYENAPEGATHYDPNDGVGMPWMRRTTSGWCAFDEEWRTWGTAIKPLDFFFESGNVGKCVPRPNIKSESYHPDLGTGRFNDPKCDCSTANARWKHNRRHPKQEYHPDPGTEALATWLEPPDGGDRRPERVMVKGYYGEDSLKRLEQVWFTTQDGEDLVHLTENVLFEPLPSEQEELYQDLLGILPFVEYDEKQIKEMAQILYTQGYRKPSKE